MAVRHEGNVIVDRIEPAQKQATIYRSDVFIANHRQLSLQDNEPSH